MTKYEKARILGTRALQISKNAPLMVDPGDETDPYRLAEMELSSNRLPVPAGHISRAASRTQ